MSIRPAATTFAILTSLLACAACAATPDTSGQGSSTPAADDGATRVSCGALSLDFGPDGAILRARVNGHAWEITGGSALAGMKATGPATVKAESGAVVVERRVAGGGHGAVVTDRFTPDRDSIRWEVAVRSDDAPWSAPVETRMRCGKPEERLVWTAWGSPDFSGQHLSPELAARVQAGKASLGGRWSDPLAPVGFLDRGWHYGNIAQNCPVGADYIGLPLFTLLSPKDDGGLSFVVPPDDVLLNMDLAVSADGGFRYTRTNHRLGGGKTVKFALCIVPHEADWRGGLRFMVARHPGYFEAPNPRSHQVAACGAYATGEQEIDIAKFRKMAFGFNWKLSDDFPYMGMFIPPVKDAAESWKRSAAEASAAYKGPLSSCLGMNDYAKYMKRGGFSVLSYFNVTEFGKDMHGRKPVRAADDPELWRDPAAYVKYRLPEAVVDPRIRTCYDAHVVDCADPAYKAFLLEQAERNTAMLPDTDGICIDRADWLRLYNRHADDGVSWVDGKPARSLFRSWISLMDEMGPRMHKADKLVYANMMTMRLELCRELDGFYNEYGNNGNAFNACALLGLRKPVVCWTTHGTLNEPNPDGFMQRHLYMGCFPTAPYPGNNHCIGPDPTAEKLYMDYGPLLEAMRGKKWVLAPHCVETKAPGAKANLFEVPGGYALPVVFGGDASAATVELRNVPGLENLKAEAVHPGVDRAAPVETAFKDGVLTLTVPLVRGCAMVRLSR